MCWAHFGLKQDVRTALLTPTPLDHAKQEFKNKHYDRVIATIEKTKVNEQTTVESFIYEMRAFLETKQIGKAKETANQFVRAYPNCRACPSFKTY